MPEGDAIFRLARALDLALAGKTITRFETVLPRLARVDDQTPLRGQTIERVTSAGKHLIIHFSGGLALRTHLRMNGRWHLYRTGERWRARRDDMRLVIATEDFEAVGFNIPVAEFQTPDAVPPIGPDLLAETFDVDDAVKRFRAQGASEIGDVLLNQRVLAGVGNIYKSEVLFACGVNPFTPVEALSDEQLARIATKARVMLQHDAIRARRLVYRRAGQPCRKCGTAIKMRRQGSDARSSYWCPRCQP